MTDKTIQLDQVARARSGDKGNHANIGVVAYTAAGYEYLKTQLTVERVSGYFQALGPSDVKRYELPRVGALNFLLENALAGGASQSLRIDTQGKLLGTALEEIELPLPENFDAMTKEGGGRQKEKGKRKK